MSNSVTTKAIAKVAAVATSLAMATSLLALAPMAHAAALTDAQVQSILSLLTSFGADASTIANVKASLTGGTPSTPSTPSTGSCTFTRDLTVGSTGTDVTCLQNALKAKGLLTANATGYFGPATRAAVIAWQKTANVTPAAGYFGAKSRAAFTGGSTTNPNTPSTPITGNGLKVSLASDSPSGAALVAGQAIGTLAKFTFANPTSSSINVTSLSFNRIGISNDSTVSNVYLYSGAKRLTDSASLSNGAFNFNEPAGLFTVPAGSTYTVSVLADIAASTSGQQVGAQLVAVSSTGTLDSSVSFPISSGLQTVSSATLATVDFNSTTLPSSATVNAENDYTVWQNTATVSTRAVKLTSFQLRNIGSVDKDDIRNFRLMVDGTQVGSAVASLASDDTVTFDLSASPARLETGGRVIKVVADVVGGSNETFQFSLRRASDAMLVDTDLNQPVLATANGSTFSARSATSATVNAGTVSTVKANNSPTSNVSVNATNVKWASFEMRASGEDVKVESLNVNANTSSDRGLDNGKVFLNGVQVGSTKDLTDATDIEFTFGSSFILKAGTVAIVDIYADAKSTTGASFVNGETVAVTLDDGSSNGQGQASLTSVNVPSADVAGNTVTISSSSLTVTKYSGYGNQTVIAGANNARLGSFVLSTGSTEGANVNTITVALSSDEEASITDLMLKDNATGAQIGTTKSDPSTSNAFSVNFTLPASSTKVIDIYANVKSSANAGSWIANADADATGASTGSSISVDAVDLQTITVGSGTLTVAVAAGNPVNNNVIAGTASVNVGKFRFSAANSSFTVQELAIKVPADAATSVTAVTLSYKDSAGATQTATQSLTLSTGSQTYATATFTGLSFYVPTNSSSDLDVSVGVPTTAAGSKTGAAISVLIDANESFKAIDSAGTSDTSAASSDVNSAATSGYGTMYVKKSFPTIAKITTGLLQTPSSGSGVYKFTMTADAAGDIEWKKLSFTVTTTSVTASDWTLYDVTGGASSSVNTTAANANGSGVIAIYAGTSTNDTVQAIGASQTKTYELRAATVSGWGGSGDDITIRFTDDTSAVASASSASLTDNMIWSDRSNTSHTTITADWTNGYLVKDMDNDTRQCQFGTASSCN